MKARAFIPISWIVLILANFSSVSLAQDRNSFAFTHANVIPMNSENVLKDQTVIVEKGKILEVGPFTRVKIPADSRVIDTRGKFLMPALSDMHVHLEGDAWNIMYAPGSKFKPEEINFEDILFLYIANGITTIDVLFAFPEHIPLREKIRKNEILGPRMILSRMIDGAGKGWPPPLGVWINNADEAKKAVTEMYQEGYDRVKVYSFLDRESYDTILATAKRLHMPVDGHVPFSTSVEYVLKSGQGMIAHVEEVMKFAKNFDSAQVAYYADLIAKSDVWVTSALVLNRNLNALLADSAGEFSKKGTEYLHPMAAGIWKYVYQNVYKPISEKNRLNMIEAYNSFQKPFTYEFFRRGGKLLAGTDALVPSTLPGFSLHQELEELVNAGLTPYQALKISTTNTYEFLGETDRSGTLEPGKMANLVLLDANPLTDITNTRKITGVMTQGRWLPQEEIERRLNKIKESNSRQVTRKFQ